MEKVKCYGDHVEFLKKIHDKIIGEGSTKIVWQTSDKDYVYKITKRSTDRLGNFEEKLEAMNSIEDYEPSEIVGFTTSSEGVHPILKQKAHKPLMEAIYNIMGTLKPFKDIVPGKNMIKDYLVRKGWKYCGHERFIKGNICMTDIRADNLALDKDDNLIIIDPDVEILTDEKLAYLQQL